MILVINLNASVDKRYTLPELTKGKVMRAASVDNTPGGKGLHVANVATILGADCLATGMLGGKSGEFIAEKLEDYGIRQDFVHIAGEKRSCLAIITGELAPAITVSKTIDALHGIVAWSVALTGLVGNVQIIRGLYTAGLIPVIAPVAVKVL